MNLNESTDVAEQPTMRRIVVRKTGAIRPTAACGCYHPAFVVA